MGWLQYRHSPLFHLPLGQVPTLWLATRYLDDLHRLDSPDWRVVLRPFSAILPTDFQYIGLWLFTSFVLQGVFGALITSLYFRSKGRDRRWRLRCS